jgi:hypothetical protein
VERKTGVSLRLPLVIKSAYPKRMERWASIQQNKNNCSQDVCLSSQKPKRKRRSHSEAASVSKSLIEAKKKTMKKTMKKK